MAKRFGRNQRRLLREALALAQQGQLEAAESRREVERVMVAREERMRRDHGEQIHAARMARDMIRLDIDALVDPADERVRMMARFDNMSRRGSELYSAYEMSRDEIIRRSDIERDAWVNVVGREIAEHALMQIMRHWRSS